MKTIYMETDKMVVYSSTEETKTIKLEGDYQRPSHCKIRANLLFVTKNSLKIAEIVFKEKCSAFYLKKNLPEIFNQPFVEFLERREEVVNLLSKVFGRSYAVEMLKKYHK